VMAYNEQACMERHKGIADMFRTCNDRMNRLDAKFWAIVLLGLLQLSGIIIVLVQNGRQ
jgi:hypothetical protein